MRAEQIRIAITAMGILKSPPVPLAPGAANAGSFSYPYGKGDRQPRGINGEYGFAGWEGDDGSEVQGPHLSDAARCMFTAARLQNENEAGNADRNGGTAIQNLLLVVLAVFSRLAVKVAAKYRFKQDDLGKRPRAEFAQKLSVHAFGVVSFFALLLAAVTRLPIAAISGRAMPTAIFSFSSLRSAVECPRLGESPGKGMGGGI